jgi:hypothetical protein
MTKEKWIMAIILVAGILAIGFIRSTASNSHLSHQHQQQASALLPPLMADGATNPSAIPDLIAFEFLLNSVADGLGTSEIERSRAKILAEKTNLPPDKIELLKSTANTFRLDIRNLDAQVMEIKDRHWPKPNPSVFNELSALQKQKEARLSGALNSLLAQLNDEEKEKLNNRILEIKKKVQVYQELPIEAYQR